MKKTCLQYWGKNHPVKSYSTLKIKKSQCYSACRFAYFASSEKVFCTIYGIEISLSPPIFEPVQLTLQTRNTLKYLSTLCF